MKRTIQLIGISYMIMATIVFSVCFFTAAIHPSHQVIMDINHYGEATIETILFGIMLPPTILTIAQILQKSRKTNGRII